MTVSSALSATTQTQALTGRDRVIAAIQSASDRTGVDFSYLLNEAMQESNLNPNAKASGSSATGLYQFIDQTWLKTIKNSGDEYGLGEYADKISVGSDGVARVASAQDKAEILALRTNPEISANMAAELAKANKQQLERQVDGDGEIGATEMYLAHFLGAGGASNFMNTLQDNPNASAADVLPTAAAANKSVFYDTATGRERTVSEVYQKFAQRFESDPTVTDSNVRMASATSKSNVTRQTTSSTADGIVLSSLSSGGSLSSLVSSNDLQSSYYTPSSSNVQSLGLGQTTSSPFATMMIAQMDMDTFGTGSENRDYNNDKTNDERRKSIMQTLSSVS